MSLFRRLLSALRRPGRRAGPDTARETLREDIAAGLGAGAKEARDRLLGALDLSERMVSEIMRPRRDIEMIDAADPPEAILKQAMTSPHSRLPVYLGDGENIVGVVHARDLWRESDRLLREEGSVAALDIQKTAMKPYFIPEMTTLEDQMRAFLKRRTPFGLVVDEYGALKGLITLEDILEEIVGEITDEFDVVARGAGLRRDETGSWQVDGAMTIRDLNRAMDWRLPDDEANTIAGLVIHEAQMIPAEGQTFSFHGFRFEVLARRENRLTRLRIRPLAG